jgi:hypothetical protein
LQIGHLGFSGDGYLKSNTIHPIPLLQATVRSEGAREEVVGSVEVRFQTLNSDCDRLNFAADFLWIRDLCIYMPMGCCLIG